MRLIHKSKKLDNICYEIRGPVPERAKQLEDEGHKIIKLNIVLAVSLRRRTQSW